MVLKKRIISIITRVSWYILSRMSVLTVPFIGLIQIQKEQSALRLSGMQGEKSRVLLICPEIAVVYDSVITHNGDSFHHIAIHIIP